MRPKHAGDRVQRLNVREIGMVKKQRRWALLILVVSVALTYLFLQTGSSADRTAARFQDHLVRRNWRAIYDMAPKYEKSLQPWDREQFAQFMELSSQRVAFDEAKIKVDGDWMGQESRKQFRFHFGDPEAHARIVIPFYRDDEGWHPRIFDLALQINSLDGSPPRDRARRFLDISRRVGISKLVRMDDKWAFVPERIQDYLDGQITYDQIMMPAGR